MKLKEFNPENCLTPRQNNQKPVVAINAKVGLFRFNRPACELLGIKNGDQVKFHQDEDEPESWYLEKVKSGGWEVRSKEAITNGVLFNNTALAREIFSSVGYGGLSGKCLLAGQPTTQGKQKFFGILTAMLRN